MFPPSHIGVRRVFVLSVSGRLIVEPYVVAAKISPEVVLLLVQTSHHAIAFAALATKL